MAAPVDQLTSSQLLMTFQQYLHSLKLTVQLNATSEKAVMMYAAGSALTIGLAFVVELVIVFWWASWRGGRRSPNSRSAGPRRVSIIIPTYREGELLVRALKSAVGQDYPKDLLEVIVAGEATDPTLAPALEGLGLRAEDGYVGRLDGVKVKVSVGQGPDGKPAALNRALELAEGEVVGIIDADGKLPRDAVRRALAALESGYAAVQLPRTVSVPSYAARGLRYAYIRGQRAEMEFYNRLLAPALASVADTAWITGSGYFIWRSDLEEVGAWTPWAPTEDLDLTVKLLSAGKSIAFVSGAPVVEEPLTSLRSLLRQKERWIRGSMLATARAVRGIRRTWPVVLFFIMPAWGYLLTPWLGLMGLALMDPALLRWVLLWTPVWLGPTVAYYVASLRRAGKTVRPLPAVVAVYLVAGLVALIKLFVARYDWRGSRH